MFLVLVFLQHHIASNSKRKLNKIGNPWIIFYARNKKRALKNTSASIEVPNFKMGLQDLLSNNVVYIESENTKVSFDLVGLRLIKLMCKRFFI